MDEPQFTTRVYLYGAIPLEPFPEEGVEALWENNDLWNALVELERDKQEAWEQALRDADTEYRRLAEREDQIEDALKEAFEVKRKARMLDQTRSRHAPKVAEANAGIERLKTERRALWQDKKSAAKRARKAIDENGLHDDFGRRERAAVRIDPGTSRRDANTSDEVHRNFKEARKRIREIRKEKPGARLRFHRFDGTGFRYFRFRAKGSHTDGVPLEELTEGGTVAGRPFSLGPAETRGRRTFRKLRAKVSGGARQAGKVYALFDIVMHRPLPDGAQINNAKLLRRRTGDRFTYSVAFSVRIPAPPPAAGKTEALGLDIGFRKQPDGGIRTAALANDSGLLLENVVLPADFVESMEYVEKLQSRLSDSATELGTKLKPLLEDGAVLPEDHPRCRMMRSVATLPANKTMPFETAYKLAAWFRNEPQTLPKRVQDLLMEWRRGHGLSYREMHNLRRKTLARRKHLYRETAARIAAHGLPVGVEKLDLRRFAEVKDADNELSDDVRYRRFLAADSELLGAIRNAAGRTGVPIVEVPAQYTSKTCSACGTVNDRLGPEQEWTCPACGEVHDRDTNAAINIARRALEKGGRIR